MGTQFAYIYDVVILAVLAVAIFSGVRRGFVSAVISMAAVVVGFLCAMAFSTPLSEAVYSAAVEQPVNDAVSSALDESMGSLTLSGLSGMDYDSVKISGTPVSEINPDYSGTNKAVFDLSSVDMTGTGFENADLSMFGFDGTEDMSSLNGRTAEFTMEDINSKGLGRLVTAQVIAVQLKDSSAFSEVSEYIRTVGEAVPAVFGGMADSINSGEISALRSIVLIMQDSSASVKTAVVEHIIRPGFMLVAETIFFVVIFVVVSALLGIIAALAKVVNKIPVIGKLNGFLGGCAGAVKGMLAIFLLCIAVKMVVGMTGGEVIMLNDTTIQSTAVFRYIYDIEFFKIG